MKKICIYSGSNLGSNPSYLKAAKNLGTTLFHNNIDLIYGGSNVGLMGAIANQVLDLGGKVTGITPKGLFPGQIIHNHLSELIEVQDMHERKKTMFEYSDGFIALPGGVGTYEEFFEILSWAQLSIHNKPIGLLNIDGFFDPLINLLQHTIKQGFMKESNMNLIMISSDPQTLITQMNEYTSPILENKWNELNK